MDLERLKALESRHGSGWRFMDNTEGSMGDDVAFLNGYLDISGELLSLWEAANGLIDNFGAGRERGLMEIPSDTLASILGAVSALNFKSSNMGEPSKTVE